MIVSRGRENIIIDNASRAPGPGWGLLTADTKSRARNTRQGCIPLSPAVRCLLIGDTAGEDKSSIGAPWKVLSLTTSSCIIILSDMELKAPSWQDAISFGVGGAGACGTLVVVDDWSSSFQFFGLLLTHVWHWAKFASKFAVEPCRKTAFLCKGLQSNPFVLHRVHTGLCLSPATEDLVYSMYPHERFQGQRIKSLMTTCWALWAEILLKNGAISTSTVLTRCLGRGGIRWHARHTDAMSLAWQLGIRSGATSH
jgi:hypothetical protein